MKIVDKFAIEVSKVNFDESEENVVLDAEFYDYNDFFCCLEGMLTKLRNGDSLNIGITYSIPVAPFGVKLSNDKEV